MTKSHLSRGVRLAASVLAVSLALPNALAQASDWVARDSMRPSYNAVFDAARGRTLLVHLRTWTFDGFGWVARDERAPVSWVGTALAYDPVRRRVVAFGGLSRSAGQYGNDETWEWDGARWERQAPAVSPSPRDGAAMAFDPVRGTVLLYGGQVTIGAGDGQTWEWDGVRWSQLAPAVTPGVRAQHAMVTDYGRNKIVLTCGLGAQGSWNDDTWEWDGQIWSRRGSGVGRRTEHSMVWDPATGELVLYGGHAIGGNSGMFRFRNGVWSGVVGPPASTGFALVYDSVGQRLLALATDDATAQVTTWAGGGGGWTLLDGGEPAVVDSAAAVFDEARGEVVLGSGSGQALPAFVTWSWDGVRWSEKPVAAPPAARWRYGLAWDAGRQRVAMYGGRTANGVSNELWEWDGAGWTRRVFAIGPGPRERFGMAYDRARARLVVFGGDFVNADTWEWDGSAWQRFPSADPSLPRIELAMAFDERRGRVVAFGGLRNGTVLGDTLEWDGKAWQRMSPPSSPPARWQGRMTWDSDRQRVLLIGGQGPLGGLADTWAWDGAAWTRVVTARTPPELLRHPLAYDRLRQHAVVRTSGATWLLGTAGAAAAVEYGSGCAGSFAPRLAAVGTPFAGNDRFALDLVGTAPATVAVLDLGLGPASVPLPGSCTLLLDPVRVVAAITAATNAAGFATLAVPVPADRALVGATAFAQALVVDPAGPVFGLALTAGLRLRVAD